MKKIIVPAILMFIACFVSAQNNDLIVTTGGDSIACEIIEVNDSKVIFNMKFDSKNIQTTIGRNKIVKYEYDVIQEDMYHYKSGTSYITSIKQNKNSGYSMHNDKKNSLYIHYLFTANSSINYALNYERIIPFSKLAGLTLGFGGYLIEGDEYNSGRLISRVSCGLIFGGPNHFVQPELSFVGGLAILGFVNYKYQSNIGIYLKGGVAIGAILVPTIGIGYSF